MICEYDQLYSMLSILISFAYGILLGVILQFVAALLGTGLLAFLMFTSDKTFELHYDKDGIY